MRFSAYFLLIEFDQMELLDIRVGEVQSPEYYANVLPEWPEKEYHSSYLKQSVDRVEVTEKGLAGNGIGYPTHIDNAAYRAALVVNELVWKDFENTLPGSSANMKRGSFGENFVVNHPDLHPSVVCIGDQYQIGTAVFQVTGPRMPCPKVDAFHGAKGVTALGKKTAWTGYFFSVITPGVCSVGDSMVLLSRPYPEFNVSRVARGLWGDSTDLENTVEFLQPLSTMECLMPRHFRETATLRLQRLQKE
jgi:MOSC domain-containing protein YiiM